jgi:hypothetical protein
MLRLLLYHRNHSITQLHNYNSNSSLIDNPIRRYILNSIKYHFEVSSAK